MPECVKCKKEVVEGSRFCPGCGAAVVQSEPTVTTPPEDQGPHVAREFPAASASVHGRFEPGTRLGARYRIVGLLGRGGMGEVYRADDMELGQSVALKFLPEKVAADPTALDRFRGEVRNARKIAHPNVCRMYDIGEVDGHVFLSMEYIDGEDLAHVLARMGRPSEEKALEIARQLCLGLAAAHENGVLHRDLKPANIMIDGRGRVRITDFGLAGLADELDARRESAGTPAYMAPEQLEDGQVSVRSDIYALGLVLHEVFTGRRAYDTNDVAELKRLHSSGSATTPTSGTHEIDQAVERIIDRCLERDPQQRPQSVYAVLGALPGADPLAAALAAGETPSPDLVASARDRGALSPRWAVAMLTTVLVVFGVCAGMQQRVSRDPVLSLDALSARAEEILRELGHELPTFTAQSLEANGQFKAFVDRPEPPDWADIDRDCPLIYSYWKRWSPSALQAEALHMPVPSIGDPQARPAGSITIVLDSAGHLTELEVIPDAELPKEQTDPEPDPDWSKVLRYAALEQAVSQPVDPSREVPANCDRVAAWNADRPVQEGGPCVFRVGTHRGRIVHVTTTWDWDLVGSVSRAKAARHGLRKGAMGNNVQNIVFFMMNVLAVLLAWHNLRLGRGDFRGAIATGLAIGCCYWLFEILSVPLREFSIGSYLDYLTHGRAYGHALIHAVQGLLVYLAVEPYVRRIWPKSLIGWARLSQGRVRDPAVGRELLVGVFSALAFFGLILASFWAEESFGIREEDPGVRANPGAMGASARLGMNLVYALALTMFNVMWCYFLLVVIRLVTRRDAVAMMIPVGLLAGVMVVFGANAERPFLWGVFFGSLFLLSLVIFLLVRVGVIAAVMMVFVIATIMLTPLTLDLSASYAPQALLGMAIIVLPALYGFWTSLGGQPLFKDPLLAETRGAQARVSKTQ